MAEQGTITAEALKYKGLGYVYGGTAAHPGDWDCSSFVSYVLGHDLRLKLPGGGTYGAVGYPPHAHGPVVTDYATWSGASRVRAGGQRPGDLVLWVGTGTSGHIGIVLGKNKMISALNTSQGTVVTPITGYGPTGRPVYRRVHGVPGGSGQAGGPAAAAAQRGGAAAGALLGLLLAGATTAGLLLAATVAGAGLALAGTLALARLGASAPPATPARAAS